MSYSLFELVGGLYRNQLKFLCNLSKYYRLRIEDIKLKEKNTTIYWKFSINEFSTSKHLLKHRAHA